MITQLTFFFLVVAMAVPRLGGATAIQGAC
jgi:hypothetical protein